jgi:hypothetical protein
MKRPLELTRRYLLGVALYSLAMVLFLRSMGRVEAPNQSLPGRPVGGPAPGMQVVASQPSFLNAGVFPTPAATYPPYNPDPKEIPRWVDVHKSCV